MDSSKNYYIVKGYHHPGNELFVSRTFMRDDNGIRIHESGFRYTKEAIYDVIKIPKNSIVRHFDPRQANIKSNLAGIWKLIYDQLINAGIPQSDIGIFGSTLVGFPLSKDIDFVVYGMDNLLKVREKLPSIKSRLGIFDIQLKHIEHQITKYSKRHSLLTSNFEKIIPNKWSALQISDGILSTIRFAFKDNEVPDKFNQHMLSEGIGISVIGEVIDATYSDFCPRLFTIKLGYKIYHVSTYEWAYQSCVKKGDRVAVKGVCIGDNIFINKFEHGVRIL